jgi:hypothetical protein
VKGYILISLINFINRTAYSNLLIKKERRHFTIAFLRAEIPYRC